ncbi:hypothetical protein WSS15_30860 [Acetobacter pasteurianus]|nr:hypothetical protein WSS15_30860 [Acetobacter pasteurianus]
MTEFYKMTRNCLKCEKSALNAKGMKANTEAKAVSITGRARNMVASITDAFSVEPLCLLYSI